MAESRTLVSCPLLRLPVELWRNIATFMTLREWAQVSGACKVMWRVPLLEVKFIPEGERDYPAAGDKSAYSTCPLSAVSDTSRKMRTRAASYSRP